MTTGTGARIFYVRGTVGKSARRHTVAHFLSPFGGLQGEVFPYAAEVFTSFSGFRAWGFYSRGRGVAAMSRLSAFSCLFSLWPCVRLSSSFSLLSGSSRVKSILVSGKGERWCGFSHVHVGSYNSPAQALIIIDYGIVYVAVATVVFPPVCGIASESTAGRGAAISGAGSSVVTSASTGISTKGSSLSALHTATRPPRSLLVVSLVFCRAAAAGPPPSTPRRPNTLHQDRQNT